MLDGVLKQNKAIIYYTHTLTKVSIPITAEIAVSIILMSLVPLGIILTFT